MKPIKIHGAPYYPVKVKLAYFRQNYPGYSLTTSQIKQETDYVMVRAVIKDPYGVEVANGTSLEDDKDNKKFTLENCETSAWGRALSNFLGINDAEIASLEDIERPDPITEEQKVEITRLLWKVNEQDYRRTYGVKEFTIARAKEFMHTLSSEEAQKFIWKLEQCQDVQNIDGGPGGYSQTDIKKKVAKITKK